MKRTITFLALAGTLGTLVILEAIVRSPRQVTHATQSVWRPDRSEVVIADAPVGSADVPAATKQRVVAAYGKLPLVFEAGNGQSDRQVKFFARGSGYTLFLTATETAISTQRPSPVEAGHSDANPHMANEAIHSRVHIQLLGANPAPLVEGLEELPGKSHYFVGDDPSTWRTGVAQYAKVRYRNVYRGVDLVYYGNQQHIEHDFVVAAGADPSQIRIGVTGADRLELDSQGELVMHIAHGEMRLRKPKVYQEQPEGLKEIASAYNLAGNRVGFTLGSYDRTRSLVIDPILVYSTYLGGSDRDSAFNAIVVDDAGNMYITGSTRSLDFPTANPLQPKHADNALVNAFVTKLSADGSQLLYSTYLGGSDGDGRGIAVDRQGNAYVAGRANSPDFPTTPGAFQRSFSGGNADAWVAKLSPDGSALLYCTYLGGSAVENGNDIVVSDQGQAIVGGATSSADFPTANAFQSRFGGGFDGFVTKLNENGSNLIYSTYLGGINEDRTNLISRDALGNVYPSGRTASPDFPTVSAFQRAYGGGIFDAWVAKLAPDGSVILSTYLGGSGDDVGGVTAVDSKGDIHFTGATNSPDFPTRMPIQPSLGGGTCGSAPCLDAFVAKLSSDGSRLLYSTYLGGSGQENCLDACGVISVDGSGNIYVAGHTRSTNFPAVNALQPGLYPGSCGTPPGACSDGFLAGLSPDGRDLLFSTYFGGSGDEFVWYIRVDRSGDIYVVGTTGSTDYPTVSPLQAAFRGGTNDTFVSKIRPDSGTKTLVSAGGVFYFAQAGGGGGFSTSIALTNPSTAQPVSGTVSFFASDGTPLDAVVANAVTPFVIEPARTVIMSSLRQGSLKSGYARISSAGPVLTNATYLMPGGLPYLSVGPSSTGSVFQASISRRAGGIDYGIALVNLSNTTAPVTLSLMDSAGKQVLSSTVNLERGEQLSRFLSELIPGVPSEFVGTLQIASPRVSFLQPPAILAATIIEFGPRQLSGVPLTAIP